MLKYTIKNENTNYEHLKEQNIDIDFSKKHLYVIQAKNSTCKTLMYTLTKTSFQRKLNKYNVNKNNNNFIIENDDFNNYKPIFYSYLETLKNGTYKEEVKLKEILNDEKISEKLLFDEFVKMRKEKIVSKFRIDFFSAFQIDLEKLDNIIEIYTFSDSKLEYFLESGNNIYLFLEKHKEYDIINSISLDDFYNLSHLGEIEVFNFITSFKDVVDIFKKNKYDIDGSYKSADEHYKLSLKRINNSEKLNTYEQGVMENSKTTIDNYVIDLKEEFISILNAQNINVNIKNFIIKMLNLYDDTFFEEQNDVENNLYFFKYFFTFFYFIKNFLNNNNEDIKSFFSSFMWEKCFYLVEKCEQILSKCKVLFNKSKIRQIEEEFCEFFSNNIDIKRKNILDFLFFDDSYSPLVFFYNDEIIEDSDKLSDGEINIILLLSIYIKSIFSDEKMTTIFIDDATISLDKENQISLAHFLIFLIDKYSVNIVLFTHDSLFAFMIKNVASHKFKGKIIKEKTCFIKADKINDIYLFYEFVPPNRKDILDLTFSETNFIYKFSIFRETEKIFKKQIDYVYSSNETRKYSSINSIFDNKKPFLSCQNFYLIQNKSKLPMLLQEGTYKTMLRFLIDKYIINGAINYKPLLEETEMKDIFFHKFNLMTMVKLIDKIGIKSKRYNKFWNNCSHDFSLDFSIFFDFDMRNLNNFVTENMEIINNFISNTGDQNE